MNDGVFISYRRDDTKHSAGWLAERVTDRFPQAPVFRDVDSIRAGQDFKVAIEDAIVRSGVMLAVIGRDWATITDADGVRRLDAEDDPVALELRLALTKDVRVIPVLVDGARMPAAAALPPSLSRLSNLQGVSVDAESFDRDVNFLLDEMAANLPSARRRKTLLRALVAVLVLALLVTGAWLLSRSLGSEPVATRIVSVEPQPPATFGDALRDTGRSTKGFTAEQLDQTGLMFAVTLQFTGEQGARFPLRWVMTDVDQGKRVPGASYNQTPAVFQPRTDDHSRTYPVWVPKPPHAGRFQVTFILDNAKHETVAQQSTPVFTSQ